jgi:hypothetical protein
MEYVVQFIVNNSDGTFKWQDFIFQDPSPSYEEAKTFLLNKMKEYINTPKWRIVKRTQEIASVFETADYLYESFKSI